MTPVGPYYSGGVKPVAVKVPEFDPRAPHGTGAIKAGLNYAHVALSEREGAR